MSCDQNSIGATTADNRYPQQLYRTAKEIRNLYLDWLRGGIIWLEEERVLTMSMMGGKAKELLHLAGGVRGNIAFDLRASSLLWNSKRAGLSPPWIRVIKCFSCSNVSPAVTHQSELEAMRVEVFAMN